MNQMKKTHFLLFMFFLSATLGLFLGCAPERGPDDSNDQQTNEPQAVLKLVENGSCRYTIVRPEDASELIINGAVKLNSAITDAAGVEAPIQLDWVKRGEMPDDEALEILIGATNRSQSSTAAEGLAVGEYVIRVDGNKIVIAGGSDYAVWQGVKTFVDSCLGESLAEQGYLALTELPDLRADATENLPKLLIGVTDQKNSRLAVYDLGKMTLDNDVSLQWMHTIGDGGLGAGIKFRDVEPLGGEVVLYCLATKAVILSYPDGDVVWSTNAAAENAHSIELTPDGLCAVASSTGGAVRLFDATSKDRMDRNNYAEFALEDAHGVLWDPENNLLWAVGNDVLTALEVGRDPLRLVEKTEYRVTLPSGGAHDLAPCYGDTNLLWVTNGQAVYQFNKAEKTFSTEYPAANLLNRQNIKGIGNFAGQDAWVFTTPDGTYRSWDTSVIHLVLSLDGNPTVIPLKSNVGAFYKVRVWCSDYQ